MDLRLPSGRLIALEDVGPRITARLDVAQVEKILECCNDELQGSRPPRVTTPGLVPFPPEAKAAIKRASNVLGELRTRPDLASELERMGFPQAASVALEGKKTTRVLSREGPAHVMPPVKARRFLCYSVDKHQDSPRYLDAGTFAQVPEFFRTCDMTVIVDLQEGRRWFRNEWTFLDE